MFREMRRKKQMIPEAETAEIIGQATNAIIGVIGDDGYPYTFPISHAFDKENNKLYFHSATAGHKIDAIKNNPKASFCVVEKDDVVSAEYTTYFKSAQGFGKAYIVEDEEERVKAFRLLAEKFCMPDISKLEHMMASDAPRASIIALEIEHMTGKEAKELTNMR